tara:strand:- start:89 stop:2269 length:2181 start_codon:yes stop_codon:yes gene_type:complete
MSALEDSLRAVYKLPSIKQSMQGTNNPLSFQERLLQPKEPTTPTMMDGSPIPEGMTINPFMPMELRPEGEVKKGMLRGREIGGTPAFAELPTPELTAEDRDTLSRLLKQEAALESAPLGPLAQELRAQGLEEDTELAHVRLGEVILPPEFLDDDKFATTVENKFKAEGINPEEAVVGGIGSLNPGTGLQQFFLKKLARGLKKVVKKVAPYAGLIAAPFTGGASAALIGGIGGAIGGGGIKGALKGAALGGAGSALLGGAGGAGGIGKFFNPAEGAKGIFGGNLGPSIRRGIGGLFRTPDFNPETGEITGGGILGRAKEFILPGQDEKGLLRNLGLIGGQPQQQLYDAEGKPVQQRNNILSNILGGGADGGFGNFAKLAGIGALAGGLGKLAYEDAKKQKGVALTPLTTMSPTGRYNIEAEIARRMGQARPNPVEFGLLPEGTLPVLSGGQPRQAALGGAIEELEGGMARGMQDGGEMANRMKGFATRMKMADEKIDALVPTQRETGAVAARVLPPGGMRDTMIQALLPESIEDMFRSERVLDFEKAANDFAGALLRVESGAVITDDELDFVMRTYMPKPGDTPNTILEKSNARKRVIQSLMPKQETKSKGIGPMMAMMGGGPIMAYAQGGAVAMQDGGEMDPSQFPRMDGDINGPGTEKSDDIPAMLSDGEFVMTARAVRGAGSYEMKTEPGGIINLVPSLEEDRERGMDVMYKVMDTFSGQAQPS